MKRIIFLPVIIMALLHVSAYGQTDPATAKKDSIKIKMQFKLGAYYNSGLNYYGRTDSLKSTGFFPMAEFWINNHFYINAAPVFINNSLQNFQYAGTITSVGYQFNDQKRWAGNFYFSKPFYKDNNQLPQSALQAQVAATLTAKNKLINVTCGGDLKFSNNTDYAVTAGIDHIFRHQFSNNAIIVIDPSAYINAGTQQFTNTSQKDGSILPIPGLGQNAPEEVKEFKVLSYEVSAPIIFAKGKIQLLLIPAYVIPQNIIPSPGMSNKEENLFYVTAGARVVF